MSIMSKTMPSAESVEEMLRGELAQGDVILATARPILRHLLANDDQQYGLVGKTPDIEREITAFRDAGSDVEVKVWGTLYPNGRLSNEPEIIVSDIQSDVQVGEQGPEAPAAETGTSVAIVRVDVANVRSGPGTVYPTVNNAVQAFLFNWEWSNIAL